ncbi:DUF2085 domain-containing protein [Candidatus Dojkabacteria bacterium]|uniref:DUF2085 domain-containing protein n=1 Tax=Candidatus Dojkabacteria bacterium TaxID=2099670 RepID=A0A955LAY5_9BACT|nr:DUF2085 domain-containing protein [Candidatus Dojkabacteria bacterium]
MKIIYKVDFWYFSFLFLLVTLPILAPILSAIGLHIISEKIYFLFSFFCHQFDTRSIHIFDYQYAWCARDFGIWLGVLTGSVLYKIKFLKPIKIWWLPIFIIPIALDGGIQTITTLGAINPFGIIQGDDFYVSNNLFRFLTGSFLGLGVALFIAQNIVEANRYTKIEVIREQVRALLPQKLVENRLIASLYNTNWKRIVITMLLLLLIYFCLIQVWDLSSHGHKPINSLDSIPKIQHDYFFIRRLHGECPTDRDSGLFNFECLL